MVGRVIAVFFTFYAFTLCFKKRTIRFKELCFICYAGMIRGAIAFALVLRIPVCELPTDEGCISEVNYNMLVSTTLILVVITTLVFGIPMGAVQTFLCSATTEDEEENVEMKRKHSQLLETELKQLNARRNSSIHENEMIHPNE